MNIKICRKLSVLLVMFCAIIAVILPTGAYSIEPSSEWTIEEGVRLEGSWQHNPDIVKLSDGTFRMYHSDASPYTGEYPVIIKSAVSTDGLTWTEESGIRLGLDFGGQSSWANTPETMVLSDGTYRMYYTHYDDILLKENILSAVSSDGINWTKEDGVRVDCGGVYDAQSASSPSIVKLSDGTLRMYYDGYSTGNHRVILSALSSDGLMWTKEEGIRVDAGGTYDSRNVSDPKVITAPDGRFIMFYAGFDSSWNGRILSAISYDGLTWTKEDGVRIDNAIEDGLYSYILPGEILKISDNQYRMYFSADRHPWAWEDRFRILSAIGTIQFSSIKATIEINPDTLNLNSKGKDITCYIELPENYNVSNADLSSIILNDTIYAKSEPVYVGDYDLDGSADLMVKFDRQAVINYLLKMGIGNSETELTITGRLDTGISFEGSDTIRVNTK